MPPALLNWKCNQTSSMVRAHDGKKGDQADERPPGNKREQKATRSKMKMARREPRF
jgi:hypothetical protein